MSDKFENKNLDKPNKIILDTKSTNKNGADYAKTTEISTQNTKVYSSEINKKNAKRKKMLVILLLCIIVFLLITGFLSLYFFVFTNDYSQNASDANFKIEIHSDIDGTGGIERFYEVMPGDVINSVLSVKNNTVEADSDVFVRFRLYVEGVNKEIYNDCINAVTNQPDMWNYDETSGFMYYRNKLTQNSTIVIYDSFEVNSETNNELNGKGARLVLIIDVVEADMNAVYTHWSDAPVSWQLDMGELLG